PLRHLQGSMPCLARPLQRDGSANSGIPLLRTRRHHQLIHRSFSDARAALVTLLAVLVFAPVSVLSGSTVLLHLSSADTVSVWNRWVMTVTDVATGTRSRPQTPSPTDTGGFTGPIATEAAAVLHPVDPPAPRQRDAPLAVAHGPALSESDLTFTKGYPQRRAAQLAAGLISPPAIPQLTTATAVTRHDVFALRFGQSAHMPRFASESRPRILKRG